MGRRKKIETKIATIGYVEVNGEKIPVQGKVPLNQIPINDRLMGSDTESVQMPEPEPLTPEQWEVLQKLGF